jgi:hypothetical protein
VLVDEIQREKRMAQVIENAHEQHDVERFTEGGHVIYRQLLKFDIDFTNLCSKTRLGEISLIEINRHDAIGPAFLHLNRVKARVATNVQHGPPVKIERDGVRELPPFVLRVVSKKMVRRSGHASEVKVVKPFAQLADALLYPAGGCFAGWVKCLWHIASWIQLS